VKQSPGILLVENVGLFLALVANDLVVVIHADAFVLDHHIILSHTFTPRHFLTES
jgi:hypothetical protein